MSTENIQNNPFVQFENFRTPVEARVFLQDNGLIEPGVTLSTIDLEAVARRTQFLMENEGLGETDAVKWAFVDRMSIAEETGMAILQRIDPTVIQEMYQARFRETISVDEINMFLAFVKTGHVAQSEKDVMGAWKEQRKGAIESIAPIAGVTGEDGSVVAMGTDTVSVQKQAADQRADLR
jgi:hypothetical protein